jgi:NAD(P)-dependent dehydrogenase (short-subunit alcohol dehydrogenase family)
MGASSGIGQSAAIRIAERGAGVIVTFNTDQEGAQETVSAIEKIGGTAVALQLEVGRVRPSPASPIERRPRFVGCGTGRRSISW